MSKKQKNNYGNYEQKQTLGAFTLIKNYSTKSTNTLIQQLPFCLTPRADKTDNQISVFNRYGSEEDLKKPPRIANIIKNNQKIFLHTDYPIKHKFDEKQLKKNHRQSHNYGIKLNNEYIIQNLPITPQKQFNNLKQTISTGIYEFRCHHSPTFIKNKAFEKTKSHKIIPNIIKQDFKLIRKLGEGKFGKVYLAMDIKVGMLVALKIVNKKYIKQQKLLNQFIRQIKIQAFLNHPNIVQLYGFFHDNQNFYNIMELGSDGHLYKLLQKKVPLTQETTSFITKSLLSAVRQLHKHHIIHRDIKPQNIVLILGNVKLCDFGWAVQNKQQLRNTFCGTPLYLSPEILSNGIYDQKVDIWAIGVLTYELHMGNSPFNIKNKSQLYKIVTDEVRFNDRMFPSIEYKKFIYSILRKNPKQRLNCQQLLKSQFIKKYQQLETCQQLCKN